MINDLDGSPQVLHNQLAAPGNWLLVKLEGKGKNTNAIGAVVKATLAGVPLSRVVLSGTSYLSQDDMRPHFGLGAATQVDRLEVLWPDGTTTALEGVKANRIVTVEQPR